MSPTEFIAFVSMSLAVGALATDLMVPALDGIGDDLALGSRNLSQAAIIAFLLGMGMPQPFFGLLCDRHGRRPLFLGGAGVFAVGGVLTALAVDIATLIGARLLQGVGAGALRVATYSTVRDRLGGPGLAHALSLVMTVLLLEPVVAPMLGQLILLSGSWRWIPALTALAAIVMLCWARWRLDESLPVDQRRSFAPASAAAAYRLVLADRHAVAHMLAYGLAMGAYVGFLTSAQAVFQRTYEAGLRFTPLLAFVSLATAVGAYSNARLLRRYGSAQLIRSVLCSQVVVNGLAAAAAGAGLVGLRPFLAIQCWNMFVFGLLAPNLTAMAMNRLGHVAGTAASVFGLVTTCMGALIGFAVGQLFDGSVRPLFAAYSVLGATALLVLARAGASR
ncbi:MFS transporter [Thauera terpenica]|nr:MFS transporter [Thauera terpenica]